MLLDPQTLDLVPVGRRTLDAVAHDPRFRRELPAAQLEIVTAPFGSADDAVAELADARATLARATGGWLRLAGAGVHPFAHPVGEMSEGERYERIVAEYGWAAQRGMAFGLHVHVAVGGEDRTLPVFNALRGHLAEVAALAGNAPFFDGADTGLASVRPKLAEGFPRQGVPPVIPSWEAFAELLAWGARSGAFPGAHELWWEARLHPRFGTIEVRCPDTQMTVADTAAIVALVQALCGWLAERHDAGEPLPAAPDTRIAENRWRALRHGLTGTLADLKTGEPRPTRERVADLIEAVRPTAERLGGAKGIAEAQRLLERNGAEQQREIAAADGLHGLVRWMADEYAPGL
jgi:carboxylate-amine ligase